MPGSSSRMPYAPQGVKGLDDDDDDDDDVNDSFTGYYMRHSNSIENATVANVCPPILKRQQTQVTLFLISLGYNTYKQIYLYG